MLIYEKWKGTKTVAPIATFVQAMSYDKTKRNFLKIHNRSKTGYLKVAFDATEAANDIYILVAPGGFWEMDNVVPRNDILVSGDEDECDVIIYTIAY